MDINSLFAKTKTLKEAVQEEVLKKAAEFANVQELLQEEIAKKQQVEENSKRTEAKYRRIFDANMIGIHFAEADEEGTIIEANDAFVSMLGYSQDDIRSHSLSWRMLTTEPYRQADRQALAELHTYGAFAPYQKQFRRKDGHIIDILMGGALVEDHKTLAVCFTLDISDRIRIEEQLQKRAHQHEVVAELGQYAMKGINLPDFIKLAMQRITETLNVKYSKFLEYNPKDRTIVFLGVAGFPQSMVGNTFPLESESQMEYTLSINRPVIVEDINQESRFMPSLLHRKYHLISGVSVLIEGKESPFGVLQADSDKETRFTEDDINFLQSVANLIALYIERKHSDEERELAKREAENANQKKSQFLSNMSHELRTPLNAVIGFAEMMEHGMSGEMSERQIKYAHNIALSGHHLLDMVNDILDIAKIESGRIRLTVETVNIKSLLGEVENVLEPMATRKQVHLNYRLQPGLASIEADPSRLRQIYYNLISNAVKFNHEGGEVNIRVAETPNRQWIISEIEDTGIGIPEKEMPNLFTEFYQVESGNSRRHEGTGLGLTLTKRLVELHGGDITVESREGVGTKFTFRLPVEFTDYREP